MVVLSNEGVVETLANDNVGTLAIKAAETTLGANAMGTTGVDGVDAGDSAINGDDDVGVAGDNAAGTTGASGCVLGVGALGVGGNSGCAPAPGEDP
jgi:hypothetical protein